MAAEIEQYIVETRKMQHNFTRTFRGKVCKNCAYIIFCLVSIIYCTFHSASHSCGSDEGSLQPSLWLPKLSSILQKLAKCSTALNVPLGVVSIELFTQLLQYTAFSTQPATHVAVMREAYSHHYGCQSGAVYCRNILLIPLSQPLMWQCCRNLQNAAQLYVRLEE